jgi:hypothetical protein
MGGHQQSTPEANGRPVRLFKLEAPFEDSDARSKPAPQATVRDGFDDGRDGEQGRSGQPGQVSYQGNREGPGDPVGSNWYHRTRESRTEHQCHATSCVQRQCKNVQNAQKKRAHRRRASAEGLTDVL